MAKRARNRKRALAAARHAARKRRHEAASVRKYGKRMRVLRDSQTAATHAAHTAIVLSRMPFHDVEPRRPGVPEEMYQALAAARYTAQRAQEAPGLGGSGVAVGLAIGLSVAAIVGVAVTAVVLTLRRTLRNAEPSLGAPPVAPVVYNILPPTTQHALPAPAPSALDTMPSRDLAAQLLAGAAAKRERYERREGSTMRTYALPWFGDVRSQAIRVATAGPDEPFEVTLRTVGPPGGMAAFSTDATELNTTSGSVQILAPGISSTPYGDLMIVPAGQHQVIRLHPRQALFAKGNYSPGHALGPVIVSVAGSDYVVGVT